jgi:hypothetical protein
VNARLRELMTEAGIDVAYVTNTKQVVLLDKFAELVVEECASLTLDYKNDEHYAGWLDYRDEIRRQLTCDK